MMLSYKCLGNFDRSVVCMIDVYCLYVCCMCFVCLHECKRLGMCVYGVRVCIFVYVHLFVVCELCVYVA